MPLKTKILIASLLGIYFFSHSFTQWIFGLWAPAYAAEEASENIIAVFVDKSVYDKHTSDINRYAQTYLQKRSSATKALLLPLEKNGFKASDMWKVLENLYLEGIKEKKSLLIGTIIIGDLPLPVIRENEYVYPSIYPYTDLEKATYAYSETEKYFVPQENGDHKAEIWQSVINFSSGDAEYTKFFAKLKWYDTNPAGYTSTKIRYDDFIALKKYFADQFLQGYTNSFLFHEDITYHRYTNLILDYFKKTSSDEASALVSSYAANTTLSTDDDYSQLGEIGEQYNSTVNARKQNLSTMAQQANTSLENLDKDTDKIPTLMIGEALAALIKPYTTLFSPEYLSSIQENVAAGGRWDDADIDSHLKKTVLKDDLTSTVLLDANTILENALYNKFDQGDYALHIPIPLVYEKYICSPTPPPPYPQKYLEGRYENFYFGKSAFDVESTKDISIYPGTWKNINNWSSLGAYNYTTQSQQDDIAIDYTERSVGASYGIASRQVEASRGYNTSLVPSDINFYNARKCGDSQPVEDFVAKYWWGISPLNVDGNTMQLQQNNPKMAWNPRFDTTIGGPVFDIAGTKKTTVQMNSNLFFLEELNNSLLHRTQHYRIAPWIVCGKVVPPGEVDENWYNGHPEKASSTVEYFSKFGQGNVIIVTNNIKPNTQACGETFFYKTIDTLESHTSPTAEQINKMTPLTADRPIDSARFVAFKSIGGSGVKILYPNLYNVPVYNNDNGVLTLETPEQIVDSMKNYLRDKVAAANALLAAENTKAAGYYGSKSAAFDYLGAADAQASPKSRTYAMLPQDFFIAALGEETIKSVAEVLYWQNLGWAKKSASSDIITDMNNTVKSLDINKKIAYVTESYLTKQNNPVAGKVPGYEPKGYEAVYINSDGNDAIKTRTEPAIIQTIEQQKLTAGTRDTRASAVNAWLEMQESQRKEKCGISKDATVPLLKWPKALACWMQSLKDMTLKDVVKISFKNAQWPALSLDQFKDTTTVWWESTQRFSESLQSVLGVNEWALDAISSIIANDVTIRLNKSSIRIDELEGTALLVSSAKDKGSLNVRITGTGDNCPVIAGKNLCNSPYVIQRNIFTSPVSVPVTLSSNKIGTSIVSVKVCQGVSCTEKDILLPVIAWPLTNVNIITPTDKVIYGSQLPFTVAGYDAYGNRVENGLTSYTLATSVGKIITNGNTTDKLEIHSFDAREEFFLDMDWVNTPTKDVTLTLTPNMNITGAVLPRASKTLSLTNWILGIKYNKQNADSIAFSLPDDPSIYFSADKNVTQLNEATLPKIILTLTDADGKPLDSQAVIKSTNGLLLPGTSETSVYTLSGKTITAKEFSEQSSFRIQGWVATVLLYPSFRAGTDTLTIEIPGMPLRTVAVNVGAASPYRTALQLVDNIDAESTINGNVQVYDKWNNRVLKSVTLQLQTIGDLQINNAPKATLTTSPEGVASFTISSNKVGGKNYVYSYIDKIPLLAQQADTKTISTITPLWKSDNLNAMYLVLGGNDRANKRSYFSEQKNLAEKVLTSSEKTLAVTTMLTNPDKILPSLGRISKSGQIYDAASAQLGIKNGKLTVSIEDIASVDLGAANSFNLVQGDTNKTPDNHMIVYTPEQTDSEIEKNEVNNKSIMINGESVWSLNNDANSAQIVYDSEENGRTVWQILFHDTLVGKLRLRSDIAAGNIVAEDAASIQETRMQGSTNSEKGWMLSADDALPLSAQTDWAGGIEDSRDPDTQTAWKNTFHALTAFAQGDKVGQATLHGASPFMITLGDPLIGRQTAGKAVSGTNYESGQGKTIFTETEKSIAQTLPFDLDRTGQKDLLVVYTDGSIRILKNNWSAEAYKNLGTLVMIAGGIKKIYVGDTDNNSYEDIIVQTKDDKIKVYKNEKGKIQVDGLPVCLALPGQPDSMENAHELFVADMDKDKNLDIITNDTAGNITVFYGGSSAAGDNYISKDITGCDADWYSRTSSHMKLVKSYGVSLVAGQKVYDNSLVRRKGLVLPAEMNENDENPLAGNFQYLVQWKDSNFSSLDLDEVVNTGLPELIQYSASPVSELPAYETASAETIAYMPIHMLEGSSPVTVSKQYKRTNAGTMQANEKIQVEITIEAHAATTLSYLDEIKGPWEIQKNEDGSIAGWTRGNLPGNATVNREVDNGYQFMVDNISVTPGQKIVFSYSLSYQSPKLVSIELADVNNDTYTDIKTFSTDSCQKGYRSFISDKWKQFNETYVDLAAQVTQTQTDAENQVKEALTEIQSQIQEASSSNDPKVAEMPGMDEVLEKRTSGSSLLSSANMNANLNISLDSPKLKELTQGIEKTVDKALKGMCQWFKLGKWGAQSGPPVPFNMAFLSPGTYNIFGCKLMEDKGLPAFFYPGTIYVGPYTVPFPYGLKSSSDGFYRADGGVYPSMIRIYVSPTITMGVGIAICFGSYEAAAQMPNPFKHIDGNCIVLAKTMGGKKKNGGGGNEEPTNSQLTIPSRQHDLAQGGTCNRPTNDPEKPVSPFVLSTNDTPPTSPQAQGIPGGTKAGGLIYFDQEPSAVSIASAQTAPLGSEKLKSGKAVKLEIQGGDVKGLVKCIINKWMDNQIRYIINNLTNLSVNLYLPDVSSLLEGFDNLSLDKLDALYKDVQWQTNQDKAPTASAKEGVTKGILSKEGLRNLSDTVSNPFDALSSLFENVPLININTQDISIQVPFLAQEDITKYSAYLKDRLKRNEANLQERTQLAQSAGGKCDGISSPNEKSACQQKIQNYVSVSESSAQLVRALKQNINTLEEYRKFPTELNKWLSVSQRYLTEVSDTVQTFTNSITNRLQINARRFEQYVDAIILVISAVKTWQVLIDFSVNRKTKCGKCRVDNYDYYACTLSLLCIDLPVLPIPPFRIPNITIDLSHINLGLDILLPKFNFVPKNIPLPTLPDLPQPPQIDVDININAQIPKIPVLPSPPKLPELPSFIPTIELNLPTLPPAPRIPKIAPAITAVIKVAGFIAKIFCIVKGGIGLVAEKGVKTRIEQMTQRTWNVEPFDSISITKVKPPIKGFDIRVDTYINMQINFNGIYDLLDGFADQINEKTNEVMGNVIQQSIGEVTNTSRGVSDTLQNTVNQWNVNIQGFTSPESMRGELKAQLSALQKEENSLSTRRDINNTLALLELPTTIQVNTDGIDEVRSEAQKRISNEKDALDTLQQTIQNNYDNFLKSIKTTLVSNEGGNVSLSTNLLGANKKVLETLNTEKHPQQSYLELNKKVMQGFANSLATHSAEDLNMSLLTYNETKTYIHNTLGVVDEALGAINENAVNSNAEAASNVTTNMNNRDNRSAPLLAANAGAQNNAQHTTMTEMTHMHSLTETTAESQTDLSQYVRGIFVKDSSGDLVNVVNRDDLMDTLQNNQERSDLNHDGLDEIIMRSEKHIWIKYSHPEKTAPSLAFTRLYRAPSFNTPADLAKATERGRLSTAGSAFKIWDTFTAVQWLALQGQDFDTISIQRNNMNNTDGYVIALTDKVATKHNKLIGKEETKYALVLASGTKMEGLFLSTDTLSQKRVTDLLANKTIVQVSYYDPSDAAVALTLTNIPRQRQYLSVAQLSHRTIGGLLSKKGLLLEKASPRSRQEVAGKQALGDNSGPVPTVRLIRNDNKETEAEGYMLYPVVGNSYTLAVQREDDNAVLSNAIVSTNGAKQTSSGSTLIVRNVSRTTAEDQTFALTAQDSNGNTATYTLTLDRQQSDISIDNVQSDDTASVVDASLSNGLDRSSVRFEKEKNNGIRSLLTGIRNTALISLFPISSNQQQLSGGVFTKSTSVQLHDGKGKLIGKIDKKTLQLSLEESSKDSIDTLVSLSDNYPVLLIKEKGTNTVLFTLAIKWTSALNTTVTDTLHWKSVNIEGGKCIANIKGNCQIYVSNNGIIEVSDEYSNKLLGKYSYSDNSGLLEFFDLQGAKVAETRFIPEPLQ